MLVHRIHHYIPNEPSPRADFDGLFWGAIPGMITMFEPEESILRISQGGSNEETIYQTMVIVQGSCRG